MGLQIWLPFTKDNLNQGLSNVTPSFSSSNHSIIANGKLGSCMKTTTVGNIDTYYSQDINTTDISFGGWFKFNKAEIQTAIENLTYTSSATYATGNIIGNDSYGGIGLIWNSNNMYSSNKVLSDIYLFGTLRTATVNKSTNTITISWDTWTHVFVTWNHNTKTLTLYKNGEYFNKITFSNFNDAVIRNLTLNRNTIFGGNGPAASIPYYNNDIRIYSHCLSEKEIKEISKGLIAHHQLLSVLRQLNL